MSAALHTPPAYSPENPAPLRRDGESIADYRARCGWDAAPERGAIESLPTYRPVWLQFGVTMHKDVHIEASGWLRRSDVIDAIATGAPSEPANDDTRRELLVALHSLASDFENALGRLDPEARRKAEGDIKHARSVAARWNWNGATQPASAAQSEPGPTCWFVEYGAVSLPIGSPSRITTLERFETPEAAAAAAEASDFNSRTFAAYELPGAATGSASHG
jgi:hypothetical protein